MDIKFCGAAREVTGSAHLITLDSGYKILLDCGLYQGNEEELESFNKNWYFDPKEIDVVVLSHAHIDHSGRLPFLVKSGFNGNIYSTHATRSLCSIMLLDSAKIQQYDAEYKNRQAEQRGEGQHFKPLYETKHVNDTMKLFRSMEYDRWFRIHPEVEVLYRDAGHILGSASVTLRIGGEKLVGFTGDIGRPDRPILRDPIPMPEVDYLICESTYGDKDHISKPAEKKLFLDIVQETCVDRGGKLIIPAFSVGRTQDIVYIFDQLFNEGVLPQIPIYVDSPLAVNATQVYGSHPECYDNELNEYLMIDDDPFGFNTLKYVRSVEYSKSLNDKKEPCVIISAAGMANAGRVQHHIANNIENERNTILMVGYASPSTPGGMLINGVDKLKLFGKWLQVNAQVKRIDALSAHGDRTEMMDFLKNQKSKLKSLFLVHGEYDTQQAWKEYLHENGFDRVEIPALQDSFSLYSE
ncbi:MBL fold metallo-hydrolase RNA specificity domain-containing protein [Membranihabitans maritimus]|uniref:MBL fold metallo-hydrolase RNA specificity domain-containing protein n=1 Tax=Membranihabitans maritimus TaxID=2904244 RepID=UPI001F46670B|nr:MBL fold metallo-hydrolase [Membranihabitans maritimus]